MLQSEGYLTLKDGTHLYFSKTGDSPDVVLVPNGLYFQKEFQQFSDLRTFIFYDVRNRGNSDSMADSAQQARGVHQDVEDLNAVRAHFKLQKVDLIGHSYIAWMIGLYATKYPESIDRIVQIAPTPPNIATQYPANLANNDAILSETFARIAQMQKELQTEDPVERCRNFWSLLRTIYVADPAKAESIDWGRCELANERNFMKYWTQDILPSLFSTPLDAQQMRAVQSPVLLIHGTKDRSAPYGGARDWARMLPNARLLTLQNVAHAPWIEAPEVTFDSIRLFLKGEWPAASERIQTQ